MYFTMIFIFKVYPHVIISSHESALTVCTLPVANENSWYLNLPALYVSLRVTSTDF
jgi:hypothetical protein